MPFTEQQRLAALQIFSYVRGNADKLSPEKIEQIDKLRNLYVKDIVTQSQQKSKNIDKLKDLYENSPRKFSQPQREAAEKIFSTYSKPFGEKVDPDYVYKDGGYVKYEKGEDKSWAKIIAEKIAPSPESVAQSNIPGHGAAPFIDTIFKSFQLGQDAMTAVAKTDKYWQPLEPTYKERVEQGRSPVDVGMATESYIPTAGVPPGLQEPVINMAYDPILIPGGKIAKPILRALKFLKNAKKASTVKNVINILQKDPLLDPAIKGLLTEGKTRFAEGKIAGESVQKQIQKSIDAIKKNLPDVPPKANILKMPGEQGTVKRASQTGEIPIIGGQEVAEQTKRIITKADEPLAFGKKTPLKTAEDLIDATKARIALREEISGKKYTQGLFSAAGKDIGESAGTLYGGVPLPTEFKNIKKFLQENKLKLTDAEIAKIANFAKKTAKVAGAEADKVKIFGDFIKKDFPEVAFGKQINEPIAAVADIAKTPIQKSQIKQRLENWVAGGAADVRAVKTSLREKMGERAGNEAKAIEHAEKRAKWFDKQPDDYNVEFMKAYELALKRHSNDASKITAQDFSNMGDNAAEFANISKEYKVRLDKSYEMAHTVDDKISYLENYFPHIWQNREKAERFIENYSKNFTKNPAFAKKRFYEMIQDGIDAGLKLKNSNPEMLVLHREIAGFKHKMTIDFIDDMKNAGLLKPYIGIGRPPMGWSKIDHTAFKVYSQWNKKGVAHIGDWVMPTGASKVVKRYLSKGFWQGDDIISKGFRGLSYSKNFMIAAKLGLSGFHFVETSMSSMATQLGKSLFMMGRGEIRKGLFEMAKTPISVPTAWKTGGDIIKAYKTGVYKNEAMRNAVELIKRGGGRIDMPKQWQAGLQGQFRKAVTEMRKGNKFKGALRLIPATMEATMKPILQWHVPRLKQYAYLQMAEDFITRNPAIRGNALNEKLQKIWASVDNRFGQLVYDNLFWNRYVRDIGVLSQISMGWNIGTFREFGGAAVDVAKIFTGKAIGKKANVIGDRMLYSLTYPAGFAALGGMMTYAYTGKAPTELLDYFYPRTGTINPDGSAERVQMPTMIKEVFSSREALRKHGAVIGPAVYATHKLNPQFSMVVDMLTNKDFYGVDIRDTNDSFVEQAGQLAEFIAIQGFVPISVASSLRHKEVTDKYSGISFVGFSIAPSYVTKSKVQKEIYDLLDKSMPDSRSRMQWEKHKRKSEAKKLLQQGKPLDAFREFNKLKKEGIYSEGTSFKTFVKQNILPGDIKAFQILSGEYQGYLLGRMDEKDKARYRPYASKKGLAGETIAMLKVSDDPQKLLYMMVANKEIDKEVLREIVNTGYQIK